MNSGNEGTEEGRKHSGAKGVHMVEGCRRILLSNDLLDNLGELQRKTQPRLDMRYLVEGAISALLASPGGLEKVAEHARQRLRQQLDKHNT